MNSPALSRSIACAALVALTLSGCATSAASPPSRTFFEGRLITFDLEAERIWVGEKAGS